MWMDFCPPRAFLLSRKYQLLTNSPSSPVPVNRCKYLQDADFLWQLHAFCVLLGPAALVRCRNVAAERAACVTIWLAQDLRPLRPLSIAPSQSLSRSGPAEGVELEESCCHRG